MARCKTVANRLNKCTDAIELVGNGLTYNREGTAATALALLPH
jgi:hypothetical protein